MSDTTTIEWTDATWNPITGCTLVSDGCRHCYAATLAATRLRHHPSRAGLARVNAAGEAKFTGEVRLNEQWMDQPLRWRKPRRIFVCAHGDLFHESVPDEWIDRVFAVMALSRHHTFQVLTKRPERMRRYLTQPGRVGDVLDAAVDYHHSNFAVRLRLVEDGIQLLTLPNVWLGTSVENQATADERIPHLMATPAAVRFVSAEPLLGPVNLAEVAAPRPDLRASVILDALRGTGGFDRPPGRLDWVIVGGESGRNARPMHPDWARSLRNQCIAAGTAFFFKQWGEWSPGFAEHGNDLPYDAICVAAQHEWPEGHCSFRVGKSRAGRLLDGREWSQMPGEPAP